MEHGTCDYTGTIFNTSVMSDVKVRAIGISGIGKYPSLGVASIIVSCRERAVVLLTILGAKYPQTRQHNPNALPFAQ